MVLLLTTALLGFIAGASYLSVLQKCSHNPTLCNYSNSWTWDAGPGITVSTAEGYIKGTHWNSRMGRRFQVFLGIPYAEVHKRFEAPWPYPRWDGVRDARMYGQPCTQLDRKTHIIIGSEYCLFLNVFTHQTQVGSNLLPVMVWIDSSLGWQYGHGGNIDPRNFMDENVVLVTFNFRQSSLGFLTTGDGEIQGNMGLKDQVVALQWVQRNIHNFGGDKTRVTIFGQDSGAASVHMHMLSPMSRGLFHRAISQSGSAHCPWALQRNSIAKSRMLATMLNCDLPTTKVMADCMRSKSDREILEAELKMKIQNWNGEPYAMFAPTVESFAYKSPAFLPDTPRNLIKTGQIERVPWIIGWNEQEGRYFVPKALNSESMTNMVNNEWNRLAPISFFYNDASDTSMKSTVSSNIKQFYFNSNRVGRESWENYTNIYTDRLYMAGIVESVMAHSSMTQVYPYLFKFKGNHSYTNMIYGSYDTRYPPSHFDELHYLFNWEWSKEWSMSGANNPYWEMSSKFVKLWASFAETGVPRSTWGTEQTWYPSSPLDSKIKWYTLDYDTRFLMDDTSYKTRLEMWKSLGIQDDRML